MDLERFAFFLILTQFMLRDGSVQEIRAVWKKRLLFQVTIHFLLHILRSACFIILQQNDFHYLGGKYAGAREWSGEREKMGVGGESCWNDSISSHSCRRNEDWESETSHSRGERKKMDFIFHVSVSISSKERSILPEVFAMVKAHWINGLSTPSTDGAGNTIRIAHQS